VSTPSNPTYAALTWDQMAKLLAATSGLGITEEMVRADVEAGAPTNQDGTLNILHYAAWLIKEEARGG